MNWQVIDQNSNAVIEEHGSEVIGDPYRSAIRAADLLNSHEAANGRAYNYYVVKPAMGDGSRLSHIIHHLSYGVVQVLVYDSRGARQVLTASFTTAAKLKGEVLVFFNQREGHTDQHKWNILIYFGNLMNKHFTGIEWKVG